MNGAVLRAEGLGKMYHIGIGREKYRTLRDTLVQSAKRPLERIRHPGAGTHSSQEFWALRDVCLEVNEGDVLGIIGRNGSGKSTLLKIFSRITEQTEGRVRIRGRVSSLLEVGTGFHPELTGRENIQLNGAILGMHRAEIRSKFDEIVSFAEIEAFLDTPVKRYSSGMYVRLAFAVAAHLEPDILLVDEVLAVGDASFQRKCLGKMGAVAKEGRTVLFVSHNMTAIQSLCSRAVLLEGGHLIRNGGSAEIVRGYLEDLQGLASQSDVRGRQDRQGSGSIRVVDLRFATAANPDGGAWATGQDSFVDVEYECSASGTLRNVEIAVGIRTMDQARLLYLGSKVVHQDLASVNGSGLSRCTVMRLPLEPGRYSVNVELKQNGIIVDYVEAAASVDVVEGDYYGTGRIWPYGGVLCDYSWSHDQRGDDAAGR